MFIVQEKSVFKIYKNGKQRQIYQDLCEPYVTSKDIDWKKHPEKEMVC